MSVEDHQQTSGDATVAGLIEAADVPGVTTSQRTDPPSSPERSSAVAEPDPDAGPDPDAEPDAAEAAARPTSEAELGDALLGLVALARTEGWDAERALRERLRGIEDEVREAESGD